jgi:PEP-CTERM motif
MPRAPIYDDTGNKLSGDAYLAQLYVGVDQQSLQPLLPVRPFLTGIGAGYVASMTIGVDGWLGDNYYKYQIRAWDASLGATYAEAAAQGRGGIGESNIAEEFAGCSGLHTTPNLPVGLQSFSLSPLIVPEPPTYALFGVGAAALLWFHRRKP